jgi:hypothetical protein
VEFDPVYFVLFGFRIYEPMVILTNSLFFVIACVYYRKLLEQKGGYVQSMRLFIFVLGFSTLFGAMGHAIQLQLGSLFFGCILFLMNFTSVISIYFCFRGSLLYSGNAKMERIDLPVKIWLFLLLISCVILQKFLLIKIHAGLALLYMLVVHINAARQNRDTGSKLVVTGIFFSLLSIVVHSLRISAGECLNHKDIAHILMILSLILIGSGIIKNTSSPGTAADY